MTAGSPSWLEAARETVDRAGNAVQSQTEHDALTETMTDLDQVLPRLTELRTASRLGSGSWWGGTDRGSEVLADLERAAKTLRPEHLKSATRRLETCEKRLRDEVMDAWRTHISVQAGDADQLKGLMQVLAGAPGLADAARRLNQALTVLANLKQQLPDEQALLVLDQFGELFAELEERLPPAVRDFVSAAAHGGASLTLLDDGVRAWLADNGAMDQFRVVAGRSRGGRYG